MSLGLADGELGGQGVGQRWTAELVARGRQPLGNDPGTAQQLRRGLTQAHAQQRAGDPQPGQVPVACGGVERGGKAELVAGSGRSG